MKRIFVFLFLALSVNSYSQAVGDSVKPPDFNIYQFTQWLPVSAFPPGFTNDGVTGRIEDGVFLIRVDHRSGVFDAWTLGLRPDGTDKTARIAFLSSLPYIKQINISSQSGKGKILVNGNAQFPNTLLNFTDSTMFGGAGTIGGFYIEAAEGKQLFDTTLIVQPKGGARGILNMDWFLASDTQANVRNPGQRIIDWAGASLKGAKFTFTPRTYKGGHPTATGDGAAIWRIRYDFLEFYGNRSKLVIHEANVNTNFSRYFWIGSEDRDVVGTVVSGFEADGRNPYTTYVQTYTSFGTPDCQKAFVFSYSATKKVRDLKILNNYIHHWGGDIIGISNNTEHVLVEDNRFHDFARQGFSYGGANVSHITTNRNYQLPNQTITAIEGHGFHIEPEGPGTNNITVTNCKFGNMSSSKVTYLTVDNVELTGVIPGYNTSHFHLSKEVNINNLRGANAIVQFSPGGSNWTLEKISARRLLATAVAGYDTSARNIVVKNSNVYNPNSDFEPVRVDAVNYIVFDDVTAVADSMEAVRITNSNNSEFNNGKAITRFANKYGLYVWNTGAGRRGGNFKAINNRIESPYRGVFYSQVNDLSLGNIIVSPITINRNVAVRGYIQQVNESNKGVTRSALFPNYGTYKVGDEIIVTGGAKGTPTRFRTVTAGALAEEVWTSTPTMPYIRSTYVTDPTNGRYYMAIRDSGHLIQPSLDALGTRWLQVATVRAVFDTLDGAQEMGFYRLIDSVYIEVGGTRKGVFVGGGSGGSASPVLTTANFASFTGAQRVSPNGNTVLDILDANTGQYVTATRATTYRGLTINDTWVDNVTVFKRGSEYWVRDMGNSLDVRWFGVKPDFNITTLTGTDNSAAMQLAVNAQIRLGGMGLEVPTGFYRLDGPTVRFAPTTQVSTGMTGVGGNVSMAEGNDIPKGATFVRNQPGAMFSVNSTAGGARVITSTYKGFYLENLNFYNYGTDTSVRAIDMLQARIIGTNLVGYKLGYLIYNPSTDSAGVENYCDGNILTNIKIYQTRYSGIRLIRADATIIDSYKQESATNTSYRGIELISSSNVQVRGLIHGGMGSIIPPTLPGSALIYIQNSRAIKLGGLHVERSYHEDIVRVNLNSTAISIDGFYPKFSYKNMVSASNNVSAVNVKNVFVYADPALINYDFRAMNPTLIEGVKFEDCTFMDMDQVYRARRDSGVFNMHWNEDAYENPLTNVKTKTIAIENELYRGMQYIKNAQSISGGGTVTYRGDSTLHWSSNFFGSLVSRTTTSSQFVRIFCPAAGDTVHGLGTTAYQIATANGIKLPTDHALLYIHKTGAVSDSGKLWIVDRANIGSNVIPLNSYLVASKFRDDGSVKLGTGHTMSPGSVIVEGVLFEKNTQQLSGNVNYTVPNRVKHLVLNKASANTANRTITLKDPARFASTDLTISNYNSGEFTNIVTPGIIDRDGSTVTTLKNQAVYQLQSDSLVWRILNVYDSTTGGGSTVILDGSITPAKLVPFPARGILARPEATAGTPSYLAPTANGQTIVQNGSTLQFGQLITESYGNNTVTLPKLQNINQYQFIGRYSAGTGSPQLLSLGSGFNVNTTTGEVTVSGGGGASQWTDIAGGISYVAGNVTMGGDGNVIIGRATDGLLKGISLVTSSGNERAFLKLNVNTGEFRIGATGSGYYTSFYSAGIESGRFQPNGEFKLNNIQTVAAQPHVLTAVNGVLSKMLLPSFGGYSNAVIVNNADYTLASGVDVIILERSSAARKVNLPSAALHANREILIRNETNFDWTIDGFGLTVDTSHNTGVIQSKTWVRAKSIGGASNWRVIEQGNAGTLQLLGDAGNSPNFGRVREGEWSGALTFTSSASGIQSITPVEQYDYIVSGNRIVVSGKMTVRTGTSYGSLETDFLLGLTALGIGGSDPTRISGSGSFANYGNIFPCHVDGFGGRVRFTLPTNLSPDTNYSLSWTATIFVK